MASVTAFCLINLPFDLNENDFKDEVIRIWGRGLQNAKFKLFKRDGNQRKGVVSDIPPTSFTTFQDCSRGQKFKERNICIKPDSGEARDELGRFKQLATPLARRERDKSHGINYNKLFLVFHPELVDDLGREIVFRKTMTLSKVLNESILQKLGNFTIFHSREGVPDEPFCVRYHTILETMQSMLYFSGNKNHSSTSLKVSNPFNSSICKTNLASGMGENGTILNFPSLRDDNGGFVPFSVFKETLLNRSTLGIPDKKTCISSKCWRCNQAFQLMGIDIELGFIAGTCSCVYSNKPRTGRREAYAWNNESFTRLVLGEHINGCYKNLRISHPPMRTQYSDRIQYSRIVRPILEDEWKVYSSNFKESHRTQAKLISFVHVEKIKIKRKGKDKEVDVYALIFEVKVNKLWCVFERSSLRELYLPLEIKKIGQRRTWIENHKGRIRGLKEQNNILTIYAQAYFSPSTKPASAPQHLQISAKANKEEYRSTLKLLNKFVAEECSETRITLSLLYFELLLNPSRSLGWKLEPQEQEHVQLQDFIGVMHLVDTLNTTQRESFENAINHQVSFIQGPPGTGKTHNASVLAIALAVMEVGTVIACAPSNEAADNLAEKIGNLLKSSNLPFNVLRVESKSREAAAWEHRTDTTHKKEKKSYDLLHDLVAQQVEGIPMHQDLEVILNAWKNQKSHMLKRVEREAIEEYFSNIEKEEARMYGIHVYTIGTLADKRAKRFSHDIPITTIIVDEAGQAAQPSLLILEDLSPNRLVFTGDHLQLQPYVESQSAADAGLRKSALEFASPFYVGESYLHLPAWTMLNKQYRMAPLIRKVVSNVTYNGKLVDSESVITRPSQLPLVFKCDPLVVLDHNFSEVQVGSSYSNPEEANLIVKFVSGLVQQGVNTNLITILSLYEAQKLEIQRTLLSQLPGLNLQVLNVDAYQGRENSVIIISFTRSNSEGIVGFTKSVERRDISG